MRLVKIKRRQCSSFHTDTTSCRANPTTSVSPDADEEVEVILTVERKELRKYSVWERQELEDREFYFERDEEPNPAGVLLLCVSETAAFVVQQELLKLRVKHDGITNTGKTTGRLRAQSAVQPFSISKCFFGETLNLGMKNITYILITKQT